MELNEEIKQCARKILAKHGKADHKFVFAIYKHTGTKPRKIVIKAVCDYFNTTMKAIRKRDAHEDISLYRQILSYLLFYESGLHQKVISGITLRSRTTVHNSINRIRGLMQYDKNVYHHVNSLIKILKSS